MIIGLHLNPRVFGREPYTEEPEAGSNLEYGMNAANIKADSLLPPSEAHLAENLKRKKWLHDLRKHCGV